MRVIRLAASGLAVCVLLSVASTPGAQADDDLSVGELQVRLVETRMELNDLYARAAAAAERLNGATYALAEAEAALKRQKAAVKRAEASLAIQRDAVATLTVDQLQSGTGTARLTTLVRERWTAAAARARRRLREHQRGDERPGRHPHGAAGRARCRCPERRSCAEVAPPGREGPGCRSRGHRCRHQRGRGRRDSTSRQRDALIKQLADAQGVTVTAAARKQDAIDERLDQGGPSTPAGGPATEPDPTRSGPQSAAGRPETE